MKDKQYEIQPDNIAAYMDIKGKTLRPIPGTVKVTSKSVLSATGPVILSFETDAGLASYTMSREDWSSLAVEAGFTSAKEDIISSLVAGSQVTGVEMVYDGPDVLDTKKPYTEPTTYAVKAKKGKK